ncbi:MAG: FadR family transcriptional regulator [Chloroflexi bacterium]|nr:FadR family transcriptional regulator [Chloroflexota bacterium]
MTLIDIINRMNNLYRERSDGFRSEFMNHLIELNAEPGTRLPPINDLAVMLGISSGKLREQLEVARELGLVDVRPKTGIRVRGFSFFPTVQTGLRFALALDRTYFDQYSQLRNQIEASFWREAVELLRADDKVYLQELMDSAWSKLEGDPIKIPHSEHRELHLAIFSRLNNAFVLGLLEAYWDAYEAVGLDRYEDYTYLHEVWTYHGRMVDAIHNAEFDKGHKALVEHTALLRTRPEARVGPNPGE